MTLPLCDLEKLIKSGAIKTQSKITWYFINYCTEWDRIWIQVELTNDTPYLELMGELLSVFNKDV